MTLESISSKRVWDPLFCPVWERAQSQDELLMRTARRMERISKRKERISANENPYAKNNYAHPFSVRFFGLPATSPISIKSDIVSQAKISGAKLPPPSSLSFQEVVAMVASNPSSRISLTTAPSNECIFAEGRKMSDLARKASYLTLQPTS